MKILIIEDSERLRRSLVTGFTHLGFVVDSTGDGGEGLRFGFDFSYDAIVLDLMLPSVDGFEILRRLRDARVATNILILTAKEAYEDRIKGLNQGADDYLCKPFSFDELHARVLTLIRRSHRLQTNDLEFGRVCVHLDKKRVTVDGTAVAFTPLEYSIVEQLALHRGKVVSSDTLIDCLYDSSSQASKNALEAHISSARKKLRLLGVDKLLETQRGFGYVIHTSRYA